MDLKTLYSDEEIQIIKEISAHALVTRSRFLRKHSKFIIKNQKSIDFIARNPRIIQIETISTCNARCLMCPTPWVNRARGKLIDDRLFEKIINDCLELEPKMIWPFLNGEPFLDPKFFDRLDYIEKIVPDQEIGIYTNATLLNKDKIHRLFDYNVKLIRVSINAVSETTYMKIMGLDYRKLLRNMELILKYNNEAFIEVSFIIQDKNRHEVKKFNETWKDRVDLVEYRSCSNWLGLLDMKGARIKKLRNRIKDLVVPPHPCNWRLMNMFILSDGKVVHCCSDSEGEMVIGDAEKESLSQIWNSELNKDLRYKHLFGTHMRDIPICRNCIDR